MKTLNGIAPLSIEQAVCQRVYFVIYQPSMLIKMIEVWSYKNKSNYFKRINVFTIGFNCNQFIKDELMFGERNPMDYLTNNVKYYFTTSIIAN